MCPSDYSVLSLHWETLILQPSIPVSNGACFFGKLQLLAARNYC